MPERVITAAEIEPAVRELNYWLDKTYPNFKLRYSSDPNAKQTLGWMALRSAERVIALLITKILATGAKPTGLTFVVEATKNDTDYAIDQVRLNDYKEAGENYSISLGTLNNTPGAVFLNLIVNGHKVPAEGSGGGEVDLRIASIERRWPGLLDKLANS